MYIFNVRVESKESNRVANAVFADEDAARKYADAHDRKFYKVRVTRIK